MLKQQFEVLLEETQRKESQMDFMREQLEQRNDLVLQYQTKYYKETLALKQRVVFCVLFGLNLLGKKATWEKKAHPADSRARQDEGHASGHSYL